MKTRVMDLVGWVPQPGGAKSKGDRAPRPDEVYIERVLGTFQDHIMLSCRFDGHSVFYDFPMLDKETLRAIAEILNSNIGKSLLSIGEIEIPNERPFA